MPGYRQAGPEDAPRLSEIAFAAKRYWGYPEEWIALWADELTIDPRYVDEHWVTIACANDEILGWCAVACDRGEYSVDYCWVLPDAAGLGIGRALVGRALDFALGAGASTLSVIADPNAEGFYRKLGFRRVGSVPSQPAGRSLPLLEIDLAG